MRQVRRATWWCVLLFTGLAAGSAFLAERCTGGKDRLPIPPPPAPARARAPPDRFGFAPRTVRGWKGAVYTEPRQRRRCNPDAWCRRHAHGDERARPPCCAGYTVLMPDCRAHGASGGALITYGVHEGGRYSPVGRCSAGGAASRAVVRNRSVHGRSHSDGVAVPSAPLSGADSRLPVCHV